MDILTLASAVKKALKDLQSNDAIFNGTITFNGDIIQNGEGKKIELVEIDVKNNYIKLRDGAISGLEDEELTGFEAEKYDGVNNGRFGFDNTGTARVGDVGDEQPLATRDESNKIEDGQLMIWDAEHQKIVGGNILLTQDEFDSLENIDTHTYYCIIEED